MKKATFEHSIDVLVKAYLNDTLEHGSCRACAVGNLVADAQGIKLFYNEGEHLITNIGVTPNKDGKTIFNWNKLVDRINGYGDEQEALKEIESTGYSLSDIIKIEKAFEGANYGEGNDEWMLNGLFAVVDVLAEIHGIDLTIREETKKLFNKELQLN